LIVDARQQSASPAPYGDTVLAQAVAATVSSFGITEIYCDLPQLTVAGMQWLLNQYETLGIMHCN
jgi:hypothetical protein